MRLAEHHRVLPALAAFLNQADSYPASICSAVRARFANHERRVLRFFAELVCILQKLAECGVEAIPYKGPVLGQKLYGDPAMRQFGDLDFLVQPNDIAKARTALQELGYGPKLKLSSRQEREYLRTGYEFVFGPSEEPNLIELQFRIVPRFYAVDLRIEDLFQRSVDSEFADIPIRVLRDEDLLLVLCVHAAKHQWAQLGMVRDIATLIIHELDWEWIHAEAGRLGITRILHISLLLARSLLSAQLPSNVKLTSDAQARDLAVTIRRWMSTGGEPDTESIGYFKFMMKVRERRQDQLRFAWRLASTPGLSEWESVGLPDLLFPMYRAVRTFRLMQRAWSAIG